MGRQGCLARLCGKQTCCEDGRSISTVSGLAVDENESHPSASVLRVLSRKQRKGKVCEGPKASYWGAQLETFLLPAPSPFHISEGPHRQMCLYILPLPGLLAGNRGLFVFKIPLTTPSLCRPMHSDLPSYLRSYLSILHLLFLELPCLGTCGLFPWDARRMLPEGFLVT